VKNENPSVRRFGSEVDKLFAELLRGDWAPRSGTAAFRPGADVYYDPCEDAVIVRLELPGIDPERITLEIEGKVLRVCGSRPEQRPPDAIYHQMEIQYGRFERLVSLPPDVDITGASADYNNGYLEITLPVKARSKRRQIPISRNEGEEQDHGGGDR
jgi:HSP20 family protein